jgi:hypothetical protein
MGRMKDLLIERQEQEDDRRLARKLGITYDELLQLNHSIDIEESKDGLIYNYIVSFDEDAPRHILDKIKGLDSNDTVWLAPWELNEDDYYEEQYDAIISNKAYYESFRQAIDAAKKLNSVDIDGDGLADILKRQIYVSIMAALEAFLSETFINLTDENDDFFRNFIETFPDFKERKFEMSRIYAEQERIKETAKKVMVEIIYHNLHKVSKMFSSTFKMTFPDISELSKCVSIRHDLVHRNGKTTDGKPVIIDTKTVDDLITKTSDFVDAIAKELKIKSE